MGKSLPYLIMDGNIKLIPSETIKAGTPSSAVGWAALALGTIMVSVFWIPLVWTRPESLLFFFGFSLTATAMGAISSIGLITKSERLGREIAGFYGMLLGLASVIIGSFLYVLGQFVLWG